MSAARRPVMAKPNNRPAMIRWILFLCSIDIAPVMKASRKIEVVGKVGSDCRNRSPSKNVSENISILVLIMCLLYVLRAFFPHPALSRNDLLNFALYRGRERVLPLFDFFPQSVLRVFFPHPALSRNDLLSFALYRGRERVLPLLDLFLHFVLTLLFLCLTQNVVGVGVRDSDAGIG